MAQVDEAARRLSLGQRLVAIGKGALGVQVRAPVRRKSGGASAAENAISGPGEMEEGRGVSGKAPPRPLVSPIGGGPKLAGGDRESTPSSPPSPENAVASSADDSAGSNSRSAGNVTGGTASSSDAVSAGSHIQHEVATSGASKSSGSSAQSSGAQSSAGQAGSSSGGASSGSAGVGPCDSSDAVDNSSDAGTSSDSEQSDSSESESSPIGEVLRQGDPVGGRVLEDVSASSRSPNPVGGRETSLSAAAAASAAAARARRLRARCEFLERQGASKRVAAMHAAGGPRPFRFWQAAVNRAAANDAFGGVRSNSGGTTAPGTATSSGGGAASPASEQLGIAQLGAEVGPSQADEGASRRRRRRMSSTEMPSADGEAGAAGATGTSSNSSPSKRDAKKRRNNEHAGFDSSSAHSSPRDDVPTGLMGHRQLSEAALAELGASSPRGAVPRARVSSNVDMDAGNPVSEAPAPVSEGAQKKDPLVLGEHLGNLDYGVAASVASTTSTMAAVSGGSGASSGQAPSVASSLAGPSVVTDGHDRRPASDVAGAMSPQALQDAPGAVRMSSDGQARMSVRSGDSVERMSVGPFADAAVAGPFGDVASSQTRRSPLHQPAAPASVAQQQLAVPASQLPAPALGGDRGALPTPLATEQEQQLQQGAEQEQEQNKAEKTQQPVVFRRPPPEPIDLPRLKCIDVATRKQKKSGRVSVCTFKCRSSLRAVRHAIRKLGWEEVTTETADCSVAWLEHSDSTVHLSPFQCTSKIEGLVPICRKAASAISLNRMAKAFPQEYAFVPKTWVLRRDGFEEAQHLEKVMEERKGWVYIAKPTAGSQGRGVQLVKKWEDLKPIVKEVWPDGVEGMDLRFRRKAEFVVQRYVTRPLVVNTLKFDCRVYCVLTSVTPLKAYLFDEGLARFCTVPYFFFSRYERPKARNLTNMCMHLTNYAVNKKSAAFAASKDHDDGSKRSLSSVFELVHQMGGPSPEEMWFQVQELCEKTLLAIKPGLVELYGTRMAGKCGHHPHGSKGFQIVGLDIIFENNGRPRLLELNANCSLSCLTPMADPETGQVLMKPDMSGPRMEISPLDLTLKSELVAQALLLANPLPHRKATQGRIEFQEKCGGLPAGSVFSEPLPTMEQMREANPPRIADCAEKAPSLRELEFNTRHRDIYDFVVAHEHTYRLFRGLLQAGHSLFTRSSFRSLVVSANFLYEVDSPTDSDTSSQNSSQHEFRRQIFDDMAQADTFFARVLFEAGREQQEAEGRSTVIPATGLSFLQFLKFVCVEIGCKMDATSEYHAIYAFVRRSVGDIFSSDEDGWEGASQDSGENAEAST